MKKDLTGKVIVITGASSGFGRGAAIKMAELGAHLVLAARGEDALEELVQDCNTRGGEAIWQRTDVGQQDQVEVLFKRSVEVFGRIDVWINNAGSAAIGDFIDVPIKDHVQVIETDLLGTLYGSYAALTHFMQRGKGTLINVASMIARIPAPFYASYAAAKHGVLGLSGALRQELQVRHYDHVHVCTVLPMAMDTPFFEHAANYSGHAVEPIPPVSAAEEVVDTFIDLIFSPKAEVAVGKGSLIFSASDALMPGATESLMAMNTSKTQAEAPRAEDSTGILYEPANEGKVHGKK